jgi:hypothetical protein
MQAIKCVVVGDGYEREKKIVNFGHIYQIIF